MNEETKEALQLLAERTGISAKQITNDYKLLYFTNSDTKIRERKTIAQLHNYYITLKKRDE